MGDTVGSNREDVSLEAFDAEPAGLARRALLAVALQAGLYLLALLLIAAMVGLNVVLWIAGRVQIYLVIATVAVTFGVLKAIFFTKVRFEAPSGLEVRSTEPDLCAFVDDIADAVGGERPDEIYLVPEVNAFVAEDTRFFGLVTRRRVLGIGVPLLQGLTRHELSAVLGHEFGHYAGGDTRLGGLVYRGQQAAITLIRIGGGDAISTIFAKYAEFMFRANSGVSRTQEVAADRFAVRTYGSAATRSALGKLDDLAVGYDQYLQLYVAPMLKVGYHPSGLFEGYESFMESEIRSAERAEAVESSRNRTPGQFDTHPPAGVRLRLMDSWPEVRGSVAVDDRPAAGLLDGNAGSARALSEKWAQLVTRGGDRTEPVEWDDVAEKVFAEPYREVAGYVFDGTPDVPEQVRTALGWSADDNWGPARNRLTPKLKNFNSSRERLEHWARAFVLNAAASGSTRWRLDWSASVRLVRDDGSPIDPAPAVEALLDSDAEGARREFEALGISDTPT